MKSEDCIKKVENDFHSWLEKVLSIDLPKETIGYAINLYESSDCYEAELVCTPDFDPEDEDWACDDIFMSDKYKFPFDVIFKEWEPSSEELGAWEEMLEGIVISLKRYISGNTSGAEILMAAKGVGIGFHDASIVLVVNNA